MISEKTADIVCAVLIGLFLATVAFLELSK